MSLILGAYSKDKEICQEDLKEVIEDFSLQNKRKIDMACSSNKSKLFLAKAKYDSNSTIHRSYGSLTILFGGQLYGFDDKVAELIDKGHKFKDKKDPAEFLVHSYKEHGDSFLGCLNGIFTFAIYDSAKDEVLIGNDCFGIHPFFVYDSEEILIFCSEYQPITKFTKFDKRLDYDAISEYFILGLPLGSKTFFKRIVNLSPGSLLKMSGNKKQLTRYDNLDIKINRIKDEDEFAEEIAECIAKSVKMRVKDPKNTSCNLSGGGDTRLILSNLDCEQRKLIEFNTNLFGTMKENEDRDVIIAKMLAKKLNLNHKLGKYFSEPYCLDELFFDKFRIVPEKKQKVTLSGLFGGEFLGGAYLECSPIKIKGVPDKGTKEEMTHKFKETLKRKSIEAFRGELLAASAKVYKSLENELDDIHTENKGLLLAIYHLTRGFLTNIYGGTWSGRWFSPYMMQLDSRSVYPLLDTELLKKLLTVPKELLLNYRLYNKIYKNHFNELADVPTNSQVTKREDSCLTPIDSGTEPKRMRDYPAHSKALIKYLKSKNTWDKGFYNPQFIKKQLKIKRTGWSMGDKYASFIKSFVDFETWYRSFVK